MTDPHRGAYTPPTDAPLTFDARRPVAAGGRRPTPWALIVSVLVLLVMAGAVFYFYRSGVRAPNAAPQPVGTPIGAITAPAPPEAQPADPAAGLEIYKAAQPPAGQAPTFAPAPEQPQPRPTTPVQTAAIPPAQPAPAAAAPDDAKPKPQVYVLTQNGAPQGQTTYLNSTAPAPAPAKAPVAATPKPAPVAAPKPATVTPGNFVVQIGAVSSTALADTALAQAASIAGGGHGKSITPVTVNGATLYRTAVTGFTTKEAAIAYCGKLKAAGKSCFVR